MNKELEIWREIPGFCGKYEVSSAGNVRRTPCVYNLVDVKAGHRHPGLTYSMKRVLPLRPLKLQRDSRGYVSVRLSKDGASKSFTVHRLVLLAFIGPAPASHPHCCHYNGVRTDNRIENLRWDTAKANAADRKRHIAERAQRAA